MLILIVGVRVFLTHGVHTRTYESTEHRAHRKLGVPRSESSEENDISVVDGNSSLHRWR